MTDSWDEVLDWERWAKEVLTDWRVPFDNHKVGLRLGITQQLCDLRDERDALAARLAEAERDAARYRFLQAESKRFDPVLGVTCKVHFDRNGSDWCNIVDLDATVDRCRATDSADDAPEKCLDCGKTIDLCGCAL